MKRFALFGLVGLLSACHNTNPLQTHSKIDNATFLMTASANAEKRLHFAVKEGDRGAGYLECMEGKKNAEINCTALYQAMVNFAREGHYQGFDSLTVSQVTDQKMFEGLADE